MFVFGEPDTRHYAGQGWHPWLAETPPDISNYEAKVEESVQRFETMLQCLTSWRPFLPMVLNVTPSVRLEQNVVVDFFNSRLADRCARNGWLFIPINGAVYDPKDHTIQVKYFGDQIHLNQQIQPLVEKILEDAEVLSCSGYNPAFQASNAEIMKLFAFDEKFGCFRQT